MRIIEPVNIENLVRADSVEAHEGFRYLDENDGIYGYFIPMDDNSSNLYIRRTIKTGKSIFIAPEYVLVFNIRFNIAGAIKANKMVEPVDFTVNVGREQE
ncbi:hypothetical protein LCGC14_2741380 [marine sediment metagenome]|uniref:Uncharacterized protein n=1 Tax=marine sediment metagenome TaxID=412755 RepID=A0A0F9BW23_9ZZZZ